MATHQPARPRWVLGSKHENAELRAQPPWVTVISRSWDYELFLLPLLPLSVPTKLYYHEHALLLKLEINHNAVFIWKQTIPNYIFTLIHPHSVSMCVHTCTCTHTHVAGSPIPSSCFSRAQPPPLPLFPSLLLVGQGWERGGGFHLSPVSSCPAPVHPSEAWGHRQHCSAEWRQTMMSEGLCHFLAVWPWLSHLTSSSAKRG